MNFRDWLISEELLGKEYGTILKKTAYGAYEEKPVSYDIYKNPTPEELNRSFLQCRNYNKLPGVRETDEVAGIVTDTNEADVFIAPRATMGHYDMSRHLKVEIKIGFYIDQDRNLKISRWTSPTASQEELELNPNIRTMMGRKGDYPRLAS